MVRITFFDLSSALDMDQPIPLAEKLSGMQTDQDLVITGTGLGGSFCADSFPDVELKVLSATPSHIVIN